MSELRKRNAARQEGGDTTKSESSGCMPDDPKRTDPDSKGVPATAAAAAKEEEQKQDRQQTRRMYQYLALGIVGVLSAWIFKYLTSPIDLPRPYKYTPYQGSHHVRRASWET